MGVSSTLLAATVLFFASTILTRRVVNGECCENDETSVFCQSYSKKTMDEKAKIRSILGENCQLLVDIPQKFSTDVRPNFIRFGRPSAMSPNFVRFGRSALTPNFVRFGRQQLPNFVRFGKRQLEIEDDIDQNYDENHDDNDEESFRRLTRKANFIRFGKRRSFSGPNFIRFGRNGMNPNFIRFG
uniref:Uncharacterized protein n=1 Tax=Romanomermis culicivorax TaxID=13658 RepID=A0A915KUZ2_ROMCU